ncbi:MAG TPA: thioesterase family protein, partial [Bryobacteraceae bacterium]|nr:thioesterase family protein [Bryobacteraceae bacterium]
SFQGERGARVLSTPQMILYMERACRECVLPMLEPGYDTLGTHVDVRHVAAAPMGSCVTFTAAILGVEERRVRFRVEARDEAGTVGEGTHERAIINVARFTEKMQAKQRA